VINPKIINKEGAWDFFDGVASGILFWEVIRGLFFIDDHWIKLSAALGRC